MTATTPGTTTPARVLGLNTLGARLLVAMFVVVQAVLAVVNLGNVYRPGLSLAALGLTVAAAVFVTMYSGQAMPLWLAFATGVLTIAICVLVTWNLPPAVSGGYAGWHWGAITFILFLMALRGRVLCSWLFYLTMVTLTMAWALTVGPGLGAGVALLDRHAGMLLVATVAALSLRRVARLSDALTATQLRLAERDAATRTRLDEQSAQNAVLDRLARPALEVIASDAPLTEEHRSQFVLLEALLRDRIRAATLLTPAVADAAWRARRDGADVVLLDDRGDVKLPADAAARIEDAVLTAMRTPGLSRLTARLLPAGRDELATVVAHGDAGSVRASIRATDSELERPESGRPGSELPGER